MDKSTKELLAITNDLAGKISDGRKSDEKLTESLRESQKELEKLAKATKLVETEQVNTARRFTRPGNKFG